MDFFEEFDEVNDWEGYPYESVRMALHPRYRNISPEQVEMLLDSVGLSANDMEFSLSNALSGVGSYLTSAAPTILPLAGTAIGAALGGPVGASFGGSIGQMAGSAVGRAGQPAVAQPVAIQHAVGQPAIAQPARPTGPASSASLQPVAASGGSPSAAQLLQILNRPEVLQALLSMALGQAGQQQISVGSKSAPVAAFTNLIGELADQAASEYNASMEWQGESIPNYLMDSNGYYLADPDEPKQRAVRLLELLDESAQEAEDSQVWEDEAGYFQEYWEVGADWDEEENSFYYDE